MAQWGPLLALLQGVVIVFLAIVLRAILSTRDSVWQVKIEVEKANGEIGKLNVWTIAHEKSDDVRFKGLEKAMKEVRE